MNRTTIAAGLILLLTSMAQATTIPVITPVDYDYWLTNVYSHNPYKPYLMPFGDLVVSDGRYYNYPNGYPILGSAEDFGEPFGHLSFQNGIVSWDMTDPMAHVTWVEVAGLFPGQMMYQVRLPYARHGSAFVGDASGGQVVFYGNNLTAPESGTTLGLLALSLVGLVAFNWRRA